jgi:prepilin-type N-terminal cleavage/methylation domain-containing protein
MHARRAFTLIELLVVVSIITLLIAILLPSLSKARELGRATVCGSNLHQTALCLQMYLNDFKKAYPYGAPIPAPQAFWPDGAPNNAWDGVPPQQQFQFYNNHNTQMFVCPTDPTPQNYIWWAFVDHPSFVGETNRSSYMYCEHSLFGSADKLNRIFTQDDIIDPSTWAWAADGWECPNGWSWGKVDPDDLIVNPPPSKPRIDWSHNLTVNMLYGDMHVQMVPQLDIRHHVRCDPLKPGF